MIGRDIYVNSTQLRGNPVTSLAQTAVDDPTLSSRLSLDKINKVLHRTFKSMSYLNDYQRIWSTQNFDKRCLSASLLYFLTSSGFSAMARMKAQYCSSEVTGSLR